MNWGKANLKVCRALIKHERVCGHEIGENTFLITVDGCYAYLFPKKEIHFNLNEIRKLNKPIIDSLDLYLHGYDLRASRVCIDLQNHQMVRKFIGKNYALWIKEEYLSQFEGTRYCQNQKTEEVKLPVSPVLVLEGGDPVGLILPMRVIDDQPIIDLMLYDNGGIKE